MTTHTRVFFKDDDFQFGTEIALGSTYRGYADAGEVLATAGRIKDGDAEAWVREWTATADTLRDAARVDEAAGRRISACDGFRRAATYYATALYQVDHSRTRAGATRLWRRSARAGTASWTCCPCRASGSRSRTRARPCPRTSSARRTRSPASPARSWS